MHLKQKAIDFRKIIRLHVEKYNKKGDDYLYKVQFVRAPLEKKSSIIIELPFQIRYKIKNFSFNLY